MRYDQKVDLMDETMKRTAFLLSLAITVLSGFIFEDTELHKDDRPAEFLQTLVLGSKNVTIRIPAAYKMVQHEQRQYQHRLGFIFDNDSLYNWTQFVNLNIITNTQESASMRIRSLHDHLRHNYKDAHISDMKIIRKHNGLQEARLKASYFDKQGEVVISVHYYSDSASLIGVEVAQRVKNSVSSAFYAAEKVSSDVVKLTNA